MKCYECGKECFEDRYPEVVFKDGDLCVCEECSIEFEQKGKSFGYRRSHMNIHQWIVMNELLNMWNAELENGKEYQSEEEGYLYYIEDADALNFKYGINYLPTTELYIDEEQKITFTVEAPYIFTAKTPDDIWFAQRTKDNKIRIYPLKVFIGYKDRWEQGVYKIYIDTIAGRYGNYKYGNVVETEIGQ